MPAHTGEFAKGRCGLARPERVPYFANWLHATRFFNSADPIHKVDPSGLFEATLD